MGKEIAPENSLFSGATDPELKISDFAPAKPETADLDLSGSQGKTTPDIEFGDEEGDSTTTDFDLDLGDDDGKFEETFIHSGKSDEGSGSDLAFELGNDNAVDDISVDFNADELGLGADLNLAKAQPEPDEDVENDATVAIDMGFDLPDEGGDVDVDMDLSDLDISGIEDDIESERSAGDDLIAELDSNNSQESSVSTEFEILDDDTIIDSELDDDTFGSDSSLDEVATKLDLAKAYMDMGDYDGASSTLEEVLAEGNESQRQEAEELLDQIT
jgi:pilus assembly protein FimV